MDPRCRVLEVVNRMSRYRYVVVETYRAHGEPSRSPVRVRPVAGQGLPADMHVECSKSMRDHYRVGTQLRIRACVKQKLGGRLFLYSSWQWPYEVIA